MTEVREARVQRRRFAPIWLVPIAAVAIAGWLGFRTYSQRGPLITITFASAEGVEAGRTRIMLRNVEVGLVEFLDLSRDLSHVEVHGRMRSDLADHLTTGTRFWVVRPRLGVGGVSGLGTLFSGVYIEMEPGTEAGRRTERFEGLEEPPVLPPSGEGRTFVLRARSLGSLSRGSPVYYRGVPVGEVLGATLSQDSQSVAVNVFVRAPHDQLVRPETRFWNASGIEVSTGGAGFKARAESLQAVILGGIAFDTRPEGASDPPSPKETEFELYPDKDAAQVTPYGPQVSYLVHFGGSVRGVDLGTPVELLGIRVGQVTDVHLEGDAGRLRVPLTLTLDPERVLLHRGELPTEGQQLQQSSDGQMAVLVARGLRAELETASLLTGHKVVSLAFHPHAPRARLSFGGEHPELPTVPGNGFDDITESANRLLADARQMVQGANQVLRSPELADTLKNLDLLSREASTHIGPTMQSLQAASTQLERTLSASSGLLGSSTTGSGDLPRAVRDLREASRSVRLLTDYLERHPEALIQGKRP
ncbi:MAG TPA: MlaD family protein [Myxococcaceae bacterium]|nr:MlaD family protein [Myxococcaceae bacterium]